MGLQSYGCCVTPQNSCCARTKHRTHLCPSWWTAKDGRECVSGSCALSVRFLLPSLFFTSTRNKIKEKKIIIYSFFFKRRSRKFCSKKENTAHSPPSEKSFRWNGKETNTEQPFSDDNFLLPNALKEKDYTPNLWSLREQEHLEDFPSAVERGE